MDFGDVVGGASLFLVGVLFILIIPYVIVGLVKEIKDYFKGRHK